MAGLYVDTSAIGRVLLEEPDAPDIAATLAQYELWASELLAVEFRRLAARQSLANQAELLLADINLVELNSGSLKRASSIPPIVVRTLDAIHLDTAVELHTQGTVDAVLTFDKQLREGCAHHALQVIQPQAASRSEHPPSGGTDSLMTTTARMPVHFQDPLPPPIIEMLRKWQRWGDGDRWEIRDGILHIRGWPEPTAELGFTPGIPGAVSFIMPQLHAVLSPLARAVGLHAIIAGVNIGDADEFRVADGVLEREPWSGAWAPTAALVLEILTPEDDNWGKLPFYAAHGVDELLIVDPETQKVDWLGLRDGSYEPIQRSGLIDLGVDQLSQLIDWPAVD